MKSHRDLEKLSEEGLRELAKSRFAITYPKICDGRSIRADLAIACAKETAAGSAAAIEEVTPPSRMKKDEMSAELIRVHDFNPPDRWNRAELMNKLRKCREAAE